MPEPGKNAPGLKGFPTPNEMPSDDGYLVFRFNRENDWAGLLLGAAQALTYDWNFYQWGTLTPGEAAEAWREIVQQAPYNVIDTSVPTPFWDDETDVDDQEPAATQTWYGHVEDAAEPPTALTFVEDAAIWAGTGFILFSLGAAGIAPAIFFRTKAPQWVMQHRNDNAGDIIRYFVDGSLVSEWLDDGSGDIQDVPLAGDAELSEHDLYITIEKA